MHGKAGNGRGGGHAHHGEEEYGPEVFPEGLDLNIDGGLKEEGRQEEDEDDLGREDGAAAHERGDGNVEEVNGEAGKDQRNRVGNLQAAGEQGHGGAGHEQQQE